MMTGAERSDELFHPFIRDFWNMNCNECRKETTAAMKIMRI